ncbi:MAG: septal ring lytic transglycosylase RlpA family protein [Pseudomonadaceae bacterium]|nr:septal ring lytic transglycosylase RlpA family protein [Pseudomonadaceae bacterium]
MNRSPRAYLRGLLAPVALALVAVGCASVPGPLSRPQSDGAPRNAPANLASLPDPIPRAELPSRYGNPASYIVHGKKYTTWDSAEGYREEGLASWYGTKFHGRRTSSGEPFNMYALTAAHRHLPVPTYVRVTNLDNQRSTIVRVNDRGPFHPHRIIDLSYAAAVKLGFEDHGTARVLVETVVTHGPGNRPVETVVASTATAQPDRQAPSSVASVPHTVVADTRPPPVSQVLPAQAMQPAMAVPTRFVVQAGAFSQLESADQMARSLSQMVLSPAYVVRTNDDGYYRVRVGPYVDRAEAIRIQALLAAQLKRAPLLIEQ